jgi:hypothetical protein
VAHNVTFSVEQKPLQYLLMHGLKPDISNHQQFGVEGWIYHCKNQLNNSNLKFDACCEPCIFVGYPMNQKGYLLAQLVVPMLCQLWYRGAARCGAVLCTTSAGQNAKDGTRCYFGYSG